MLLALLPALQAKPPVPAPALLIALEADPQVPSDRRTALQGRFRDLKAALEVTAGLKVVASGGPRPDRVLVLSDENGLTARIRGGDLTAFESHVFNGRDPDDVAAGGLSAYLERELFAKRLWGLAAVKGRMAWSPRMVHEVVGPKEKVEVSFAAPKGGYLYLLNRNEADGEIKLLFPYSFEPDAYFAPGSYQAPKYYQNEPGESASGASVLVAIFVPAERAALPPLPPYRRGDSFEAAERALLGPLDDHLRTLWLRLAKPQALYGAARLAYRFP